MFRESELRIIADQIVENIQESSSVYRKPVNNILGSESDSGGENIDSDEDDQVVQFSSSVKDLNPWIMNTEEGKLEMIHDT